MKVKYIGQTNPFTLTHGKIYPVESIELNSYRIIDETEEDYLYQISLFEIVEPNPPAPVVPSSPKPPGA